MGKCSAHSVRFVQLYNYCTVLPCLALLFFRFFFPLLLAGVSVGCFRPRDAQPLLRYAKRKPCTTISLRNLADSVVSCATDTPVSNAQQSSVCVVSCVRAPYLRACRRARSARCLSSLRVATFAAGLATTAFATAIAAVVAALL